MQNLSASVLIRREPDTKGKPCWVAQVLEYDLAAQASTIDDLVYELQRILVAHMVCAEAEGLVPFHCLPPAPQDYHVEFAKGRGLTVEMVRVAPAKPTLKRGTDTKIDQLPAFVTATPPTLAYRLYA